jgi:cyclic pyranopterin phosphate synthase
MPFDGNRWNDKKFYSYAEMLSTIKAKYPLERLQVDFCRAVPVVDWCVLTAASCIQDHPNDTSKSWHVPGFKGANLA